MKKWIKENFEVEKDIDNIEFIIFEHNGKTIKIATTSLIDSNLQEPITLEKLKSIDPQNKIGWHKYFEDWQQKGILN